MINTMIGKKQPSFFEKYKKWFLALAIWQIVPLILLIGGILGSVIYAYVSKDANFHSYKPYIISGFKAGHVDGASNYTGSSYETRKALHTTPWRKYKTKTNELKEKINLEREEYLMQFPESERGTKLAEMKLNNIKLPIQLELEKRFTSGLGFYADYVKQKVKREEFKSDTEYLEALQDEAWKAGYEYGYREGLDGTSYNRARSSLR